MSAPDKIYMPTELLSEEWRRHIEGEDIEYIRKDYLLEWAKREKAKLLEEKPTYVSAGINLGIDKLIRKLNQM